MRRHRPRDGQVAVLTLVASALRPDMTAVVSAKMYLCGPGLLGPTIELSATLGAATTKLVECSHVWSATAGEAQAIGEYRMWAVTKDSRNVEVASDPHIFNVVRDQDRES